jgi:hypothetical protein
MFWACSDPRPFFGVLKQIEVDGVTDVPYFAMTSSSHETQLRTQFHATVNAGNGDTFLQKVAANLRKTTVWSEGSMAGGASRAKKLRWNFRDGRIQDLLLLFTRSQKPSMSGLISFKARVVIPGATAFD